MNTLATSKAIAVILLLLSIIAIVISFIYMTAWYDLIDEFLFFMMAFTHLMAVYLAPININAGRKLQRVSVVLLILTFIAFFVSFLLMK